MSMERLVSGWKVSHGMGNWNPPDVSLDCLNPAGFRDLNGNPLKGSRLPVIYKFPWYLSFLYLWHGIKHWCKTWRWPDKILYFSDEEQRDKEIFLEVVQHPQNYLRYDGWVKYGIQPKAWTVEEEDVDLDERFEEGS